MQKRILFSVFSVIVLSLVALNITFGEEEKKKGPLSALSREDRSKVIQTLELNGNDITKALNAPDKLIVEPLLTAVENRNAIRLNRNSMMKTNMCISDLMCSAAHLSKISTGNTVVKAKIKIDSESRKTSMYTHWKKRNLEDTTLTFILFYDDNTVAPTEFACSGYRYY